MPTIEFANIIPGAISNVLTNAGVPGAGTSEIWTVTIGGTPTAGTFKIGFGGERSGAITWSSTNNTLLSNVNTKLDAMSVFGAGDLVATDATLSNGIGTFILTFSANLAKLAITTPVTVHSSLTGTNPTLAVAETTPGVTASFRGVGKGVVVTDTTNAIAYTNTGTAIAPTWTKVGVQT